MHGNLLQSSAVHVHSTSYIYIYAFSRPLYPKATYSAFRLYIFVSMCVPWELNPRPMNFFTRSFWHDFNTNRLIWGPEPNAVIYYKNYIVSWFTDEHMWPQLCFFFHFLKPQNENSKHLNAC